MKIDCGRNQHRDILFKALGDWMTSVTHFGHEPIEIVEDEKPIDVDAAPKLGSLKDALVFLASCQGPYIDESSQGVKDAAQALQPDAADSTVKSLCAASLSIGKMLSRLQEAQACKAITEWLQGGLKEVPDYKIYLPKALHSVAHSTQTNWASESQKLDPGTCEAKDVIAKLDLFESAASLHSTGPIVDNEEFIKVLKDAGEYADLFLKSLTKLVQEGSDTFQNPLIDFLQKYDVVGPALESNSPKDVEWLWQKDQEKTVQQDIEGVRSAMRAAGTFFGQLGPLSAHQSQHAAMQEVSKLASSENEQYGLKVNNVCKTVLSILYGSVLYGTSGNSKEDVEWVDKYAKKAFNMKGRDVLPEKMNAMLKDICDTKAASAGKLSKDKSEKEKPEKKEKKRKSNASEPDAAKGGKRSKK